MLIFSLTASATELVKEVSLVDGRAILASSQNGLTLYTFDVDDPGVSNCHGKCLNVWPAMLVSSDDNIEAPFGVTVRPNGDLQLMLNNEPLYFFIGDESAGDIRGDNLQGVWHIIPTNS